MCATRTATHSPNARVEMTFRLGDQLYAIEHTGIEPFGWLYGAPSRAPALFKPLQEAIEAVLSALLTTGIVIEMHMPVDAFAGRKMPEVQAIHAALVEWVRVTAPTLPPRRYADYRGTLVTAQPAYVPFSVSLVRFDGIAGMVGRFQLKHLAPGSDGSRVLRIERACEKKFPKLDIWKRSDNARTVLVFEYNDVQLTNVPIVADIFLPIAKSRADAPDETYMVSTCTEPWYAWPLLVKGQTYFDLAAISHPIHFEIDASRLPLTDGSLSRIG